MVTEEDSERYGRSCNKDGHGGRFQHLTEIGRRAVKLKADAR
jgi:hypothetical protein